MEEMSKDARETVEDNEGQIEIQSDKDRDKN